MNKMIVDRLEGSIVVLEYKGKTYEFPGELLPEEVKEGDVLKVSFKVDKNATVKRKKEIEKLMDEVFNLQK
ncbi:MAG: hypothetical protein PWQ96_518 [Clostridia bacterium]|nr:hypothetical protein [Clostridiales bacterium]MDK2984876.1 hypothetical protein [Clostridia bacterium]